MQLARGRLAALPDGKVSRNGNGGEGGELGSDPEVRSQLSRRMVFSEFVEFVARVSRWAYLANDAREAAQAGWEHDKAMALGQERERLLAEAEAAWRRKKEQAEAAEDPKKKKNLKKSKGLEVPDTGSGSIPTEVHVDEVAVLAAMPPRPAAPLPLPALPSIGGKQPIGSAVVMLAPPAYSMCGLIEALRES